MSERTSWVCGFLLGGCFGVLVVSGPAWVGMGFLFASMALQFIGWRYGL